MHFATGKRSFLTGHVRRQAVLCSLADSVSHIEYGDGSTRRGDRHDQAWIFGGGAGNHQGDGELGGNKVRLEPNVVDLVPPPQVLLPKLLVRGGEDVVDGRVAVVDEDVETLLVPFNRLEESLATA